MGAEKENMAREESWKKLKLEMLLALNFLCRGLDRG